MQFCPECKFLTYTKLNEAKNQLLKYCKTCSWEGDVENTDNSVYKRNYEEDYIADKIVTNKYTIYDVSLPRVEYDCTNPNCYTRQNINNELSFIVNNISQDDEDRTVYDLFIDKREDMSNNPVRIRLDSVLIQCKNAEKKKELMSYYNTKFNDKGYKIGEMITPPKKEVLYIKYDPINMKYLYMCVNCGTSWKKN